MQSFLEYLSNYSGKWHRRIHSIKYYSSRAYLGFLPYKYIKKSASAVLKQYQSLPEENKANIALKVAYYNKLNSEGGGHSPQPLSENLCFIGDFKSQGSSTYFYDLADYLRYFPAQTPFAYIFGDVQYVPKEPSFVKSRPIMENNQNSVLLKLDSIRHFYTYKDPFCFRDKKGLLVWRGAAYQPHRKLFLEQFADNPNYDVKCVAKNSIGKNYHGDFMSIRNQLRYKYILSIEGNDVATNLKWIMASNSLTFMTTPKFETWLMEGLLKPDFHYVHLKDDYSDLEEKFLYYKNHPQEAELIIKNAQEYMKQFFDKKQEIITTIMVMKKYFDYFA